MHCPLNMNEALTRTFSRLFLSHKRHLLMLALLVISTDRDHRKIIEIERFTLRAAMSVKTT